MSYSDDGNGYFTRALDAEDRGDHALAETAYRQAIELFREGEGTERELAACHYNLGHVYVVTEQTSRAVVEYGKALEHFAGLEDSGKHKARAHLILGSLLVETGDLRAAEDHLLDTLGQYLDAPHDPRDQADCYVNLARVYRATRRPTQAVTAYNRAVDFYQEDPETFRDRSDCFTELGSLNESTGKLDESAAAFAEAARLRRAAEQQGGRA